MITYYEAQVIKSMVLIYQVNLYTALTRQEMFESLSEGQFVSNIAINAENLQLYYNDYIIFPSKPANPHVTPYYNLTPSGKSMEQTTLLNMKLAHMASFENTEMYEYTRSLDEPLLTLNNIVTYFLVAQIKNMYECTAESILAYMDPRPMCIAPYVQNLN
jgi:hypothetical protein